MRVKSHGEILQDAEVHWADKQTAAHERHQAIQHVGDGVEEAASCHCALSADSETNESNLKRLLSRSKQMEGSNVCMLVRLTGRSCSGLPNAGEEE